METPHERLKWARETAGYESAAAFARKYGISEVTYRAHEAGARGLRPGPADRYARVLRRKAKLRDLTAGWILYGDGDFDAARIAEPDLTDTDLDDDERAMAIIAQIVEVAGEEYGVLPRLEVVIAAGDGTVQEQEIITHSLLFRMAWLRSVTNAPLENLVIVEIDGDSMDPTFRTGDHALVDRSQILPSQKDGLYVLWRDGGAQVKRVSVSWRTGLYTIKSDNPEYPTDTEVKPDKLDIRGRVIWIGRKV